MVDVGEHYRPTDGTHDPGVYRVVGTTDAVTLLRVADGDGRRAHTGEISRVSERDLDTAFEPASDPDAGINPVFALRNVLSGMYWNVRKFL